MTYDIIELCSMLCPAAALGTGSPLCGSCLPATLTRLCGRPEPALAETLLILSASAIDTMRVAPYPDVAPVPLRVGGGVSESKMLIVLEAVWDYGVTAAADEARKALS
jgi:hypothetical protein